MSLANAVQNIIDEMEAVEQPFGLPMILKFYAKQLKIALKASEGSSPINGLQQLPPPHVSNRDLIEKCKEEFRQAKKRSEAEEGLGENAMEVVDDPDTEGIPTVIIVPPGAEPGRVCINNGKKYVVGADNKLHFKARMDKG